MYLETPFARYRWDDRFLEVPDRNAPEGARTHGIAVSRDGFLFVIHHRTPAVLVFSPEGHRLRAWGDYPAGHGITLVEERGREFLWLADGDKGIYKTTLEGEVVAKLDPPAHLYSNGKKYRPTQVAVNERRHGGNGDVWVSDGYGPNFLHRYDEKGCYLASISGEEGGLAFSCPHGVSFLTVDGERTLWVADRSNRVIQVFNENGEFVRRFGQDDLIAPNGFTEMGERVLIPELKGRLTFVDRKGNLICHLGENRAVLDDPGWPNEPAGGLRNNLFNSPHYAAVDAEGNIFVAEWILGGRITRLKALPD